MATSSFYQSSGSTPAAENSIQTSVTQASGFADAASASATAAATSATNAQTSLNSFNDKYLGAYTTAPTTSTVGALYFNTVSAAIFVWSGTQWVLTAQNIINDTDDVVEGSTNQYFTNERVDDRVNALLVAGSNVTLTYNDTANTLTIASTQPSTTDNLTEGSTNKYYTDERVDDRVNGLLVAGSGITLTYDDAANSLTVANTVSAPANTDALTEGSTNLYFTNARADARIAAATTDSLSEGSTNLYFTNARATSAITGSDLDMGGNKVLFGNLYSNESDLPSASTYHGMFAHVHATGKGYFAHGGAWRKLLDETSSDTDDLSEGSSNLYFTNERVDDRVNALLTAGSNITLTYDDAANTLSIASTAGAGTITLANLSATNATASGGGSLAYNNSNGVFTFTPPDLSSYASLTNFSVSTASAGTSALSYNNANGVFTFTPPDLSSYVTAASSTTFTNKGGNISQWTNDSGYLTGITGQSLYSLSNVFTSSSPSDGQVLTWDNANSYWKPTTVAASGGGEDCSYSDYIRHTANCYRHRCD